MSGDQTDIPAQPQDCHRKGAGPAPQPDHRPVWFLYHICRSAQGASDLWINDTIPVGLVYNQSSLYRQGLEPRQEVQLENEDGSRQICRFFGDAGEGRQIEIGYS